MSKFIKRLVSGKKGMEALQAVVLIAIALVISSLVQSSGKKAATTAGDNLTSFVGGGGN